MPASNPSRVRSLKLPNGLRVELCSAPRLKRCAAALRVAAGSHDVPEQWPGLAHFLEHVFFLGTERFPTGQHLMAYVQRHGGQVNASTRERTTDFFFELAPAVFAGGLERLCDMLIHPRMSMDDQLREREVLHAEFIAWSRDSASRDQLKRLQVLSARHPLRGFHAGNRFSLPVPRPVFQQALQDFYRRFYQAGQMTLSLAGPQTLDELQDLATTFGSQFAKGHRIEQLAPPALMDKPVTSHSNDDGPRQMYLMFACEGLPEGHEQAATFLCTWMNNPQPGGLLAQLRERGLIESMKVQTVYAFAGQVLLEVAMTPGKAPAPFAPIQSLIFNWLAFFKTRYHELLDEFARLEQRQLAVNGALPLARHYSAEPAALNEGAINPLLDQMTSDAPQQPTPQAIEWRLPEPNPFLRTPRSTVEVPTALPALTLSDALASTGEGAVYLRWHLTSPQPKLHTMLNDSLKTLSSSAQQAGVTLAFTAYGTYWQLMLSGLAEAIAAVLEQALKRLAQPDAPTLARYGQPSNEPVPIPIRQLLKTLPDHFLNSPNEIESPDLQQIWASSRWTGFTAGFNGTDLSALSHALTLAPGVAATDPTLPHAQSDASRWAIEPSESSEDAVLMFYPTPTTSLEDEAIWRLFAQLIQAPFYQRLRVELQLGYAVFSGFRQIAGQSGLLFGVQSPGTRAESLVEHIRTCLQTLPTLIAACNLREQIANLRDQLDLTALEHQHAAEMLWQANLAGHCQDYPERLQHALAHLSVDALQQAARRMTLPEYPMLILSNRAKPHS